MKAWVDEENWLTGLWARKCANIQQILISKFAYGPEKLPSLWSRIVLGPNLEYVSYFQCYKQEESN